ncbi:MAG: tyrosine-type recombinase/integrase [Dehalococcoidia bacterium]|nr:tyrosine-type recombinase/integrase [Dehalococcoidia bacterium]
MNTTVAYLDESAAGWERSLYAFLAEKERRSGSLRTVQSYSRMLQHFFGRAGKTPDQVTSQDVFAWAYGTGLSGKPPGSITIGARVACLSSFYRFLIRMKVVASNPCDALERPKVTQGAARGLSGEQIHRLLDVVPPTAVGLRDRAIILTLTFTGRRRAEVLGMTAGSIQTEGETVFYSYRGKGGKTGKRELPRPAYDAMQIWLACVGKDMSTMAADASLWPDTRNGRGINSGTFYTNLRRYLRLAGLPHGGVHIFRHSAAKLRRDAGESIEDVSRFLDHSSLAVTTTYLRRLEGQTDKSWLHVAEALHLV